MNRRQLLKLGIPEDCVGEAVNVVRRAAAEHGWRGNQLKQSLQAVVADPRAYAEDPLFGELARSMAADASESSESAGEPVSYRTWGDEIDPAAHQQMETACSVPGAVGGALMPDAHLGYGLPIGGVLAVENAVIPYAVGVDIACRMKLSVLDMPADSLEVRSADFREALESQTRFGVGVTRERPPDHPVLDQDWTITRITREKKDTARAQLGTSGSGNHFVDFGILTVDSDEGAGALGLDPGRYVALMSHSGSRGPGAAVCSTYSQQARARVPKKLQHLANLAWLSLDTQEGQEYWAAMNLMGDYAAANHDVIHRLVTRHLGARIIGGVENHHNFAWRESHEGRDLIVHRKGATPAGPGVLGVIPGSMADPAFVVRGRGHPASFNSAAHGAGRRMSRRKAKDTFAWKTVQRELEERGVQVLSAGADEVPGVYKDIREVMRQQQDLVDVIARFDPRIVKMSR